MTIAGPAAAVAVNVPLAPNDADDTGATGWSGAHEASAARHPRAAPARRRRKRIFLSGSRRDERSERDLGSPGDTLTSLIRAYRVRKLRRRGSLRQRPRNKCLAASEGSHLRAQQYHLGEAEAILNAGSQDRRTSGDHARPAATTARSRRSV